MTRWTPDLTFHPSPRDRLGGIVGVHQTRLQDGDVSSDSYYFP